MKLFIKAFRSLLYSILAWIYPVSVLIYLLSGNPDSDIRIIQSEGTLVYYTLLIIVTLGIFHQLSNWLTNIPTIRRSSLLTIILIRMALMTVLVISWETINIARFFAPESGLKQESFIKVLHTGILFKDLLFLMLIDTLYAWLYQLRTVIGHKIFPRLLLGTYRNPRTEKRVFMFIDMQDSTTHAEKLGHLKFTKLIQECFKDFDIISLNKDVDIYKYVGDEVIVSWDMDSGIHNANCLRLFFDFQKILKERESHYIREFGFLPKFKAGVHPGEVTVAETGVSKRSIEYLSDVLNTAARLQGVCNNYKVDFVMSGKLKSLLGKTPGIKIDFIESVQLKGKQNHIDVYHVDLIKQ